MTTPAIEGRKRILADGLAQLEELQPLLHKILGGEEAVQGFIGQVLLELEYRKIQDWQNDAALVVIKHLLSRKLSVDVVGDLTARLFCEEGAAVSNEEVTFRTEQAEEIRSEIAGTLYELDDAEGTGVFSEVDPLNLSNEELELWILNICGQSDEIQKFEENAKNRFLRSISPKSMSVSPRAIPDLFKPVKHSLEVSRRVSSEESRVDRKVVQIRIC